jgi:hypothetical protein
MMKCEGRSAIREERVGPSFRFALLLRFRCSPDGAERNPGTTGTLSPPLPDYAALHPGYEEERKKKKEAERRQTQCLMSPCQRARLRATKCRLAPTLRCGRARLSAFHRGSALESVPSLGAAPGHASGDLELAPILSIPIPGAEACAVFAGVTRLHLSPPSEHLAAWSVVPGD